MRIVGTAPERFAIRLVPYLEMPIGNCRAEPLVTDQGLQKGPDQLFPSPKVGWWGDCIRGNRLRKEVQPDEWDQPSPGKRFERRKRLSEIRCRAGAGPYLCPPSSGSSSIVFARVPLSRA